MKSCARQAYGNVFAVQPNPRRLMDPWYTVVIPTRDSAGWIGVLLAHYRAVYQDDNGIFLERR